MPEGSPDHGRKDEIRLAEIVHPVRYREQCVRKLERRLTLYVMKMSMRKNDRKTCAPYSAARVTRAVKGSGVLHDTDPGNHQHSRSSIQSIHRCRGPQAPPAQTADTREHSPIIALHNQRASQQSRLFRVHLR